MAQEELAAARACGNAIPRGQRPALLLAPLTDAYLRRLRNSGFDLLTSDVSLTPLRKQLAVGWAALRGSF